MDLYDKDGNFVGKFIANEKEKIEETFDAGWWPLAIIFLLISPFWTIFVIVLWLVLKGILAFLKFILKVVWWILRVPFNLIFYGCWPEFSNNKQDI